MLRLCVLLSVLLLFAAPAFSQAIISTDFARDPLTPAVPAGVTNERVTGSLCGGWVDDSAWGMSWAKYERRDEIGDEFVRVTVSRVEKDSACQILYNMPALSSANLYSLKFTARSASGVDISFGIRRHGAPWDYQWSSAMTVGREWKQYEYLFQIPSDMEAGITGFYIRIGQPGVLDLKSFTLEALSREKIAADIRAKYPKGTPRNLIRITRFPLGLQSGWTVDRYVSEVSITPDKSVIGISGYPSLKVVTTRYTRLFSEPVRVIQPFEKHTASLYVRGNGKISVSILADSRFLAETQRDFSSNAQMDWQRIELTFDSNPTIKHYSIVINALGTFWIDALQMEQGATATPYASQLLCEVSLSVDSPIRVLFDDQKPVFKWTVTGKPTPGSKLKLTVFNLYGEKKDLPKLPLPRPGEGRGEGSLVYGTSTFSLFPSRPLGMFRVEAQVVDANNQPISAPNEILISRLKRPRYWGKDAPDSQFGTHILPTTRQILLAKASGINWCRLWDPGVEILGWYYLERHKGQWTFYDEDLMRLRKGGISVLGELVTTPEWAGYYKSSHHYFYDRLFMPRDLADWENYVRTVVTRYKGVVNAYEVWNEPWSSNNLSVDYGKNKDGFEGYLTSDDLGRDYSNLLKSAYKAAKSADPKVTIIGSAYAGQGWSASVNKHNGFDACDAVSYHNYAPPPIGFPGDSVSKMFDWNFHSPDGVKTSKPTWMTEGTGVFMQPNSQGFYHYTFEGDAQDDYVRESDKLCRYVISQLAQGNKRVFTYSMSSYMSFCWQDGASLALTAPDGFPHPLTSALSAMTWRLEDTKFNRVVQIRPNLHAYIFAGKGRTVAALSDGPGAVESGKWKVESKDGVEWADLYGNPLKPGSKYSGTLVYATGNCSADEMERMLKR